MVTRRRASLVARSLVLVRNLLSPVSGRDVVLQEGDSGGGDRRRTDHPSVIQATADAGVANEPTLLIGTNAPDVRGIASWHSGEPPGAFQVLAEEHPLLFCLTTARDPRDICHATPIETVPSDRLAIAAAAGVKHRRAATLDQDCNSPRALFKLSGQGGENSIEPLLLPAWGARRAEYFCQVAAGDTRGA